MDSNLFAANCPGVLVRIKKPTKDWAFVPNELPPDWQFPNELWPLLARAREALGTLNGIGQTLSEPRLLLRPLQTREAISSSRIEGTYVTPEQLLLYELDPREPGRADEKMADWYEVLNYYQALIHGCKLLEELPVCNRLIKEIHRVLLDGVRGAGSSPGQFRKLQVQIGSRGRFIPPPPTEVARLMSNLERCVNKETDYDPLVFCYLVHYQFEAIHPFRDGNGRVGRLLLSLMIQSSMKHAMPWLYMSAYFEQFKEEYIDKLFKISTKGDWTSWIEFCLRGTINQAEDSINRCAKFNALRTEFHRRIGAHSSRTYPIVDGLFTSPVLTVSSLAKSFNVAYHTARADIRRLVEAGILKEREETHPRSFYSPEVMEIAYNYQPSSDDETEDDDAASDSVQPTLRSS